MREHAQELAYEAALRALDQQQRAVDELRGRAGTLISAVAISTSFLGGSVLAKGDLTVPSIVAVILFVLAIAACVVVLVPRRKWMFRVDPLDLAKFIEEQPMIEMPGWYQGLADEVGNNLALNDKRFNRLAVVFSVGAVLLALELGMWIVVLVRGA